MTNREHWFAYPIQPTFGPEQLRDYLSSSGKDMTNRPHHTKRPHHMGKGEVPSKKQGIILYRRNNPKAKAEEIAEHFCTTRSYVWNVLSEERNRKALTSDIWRGTECHGLINYWVETHPAWVEDLGASVVNSKTGMKQIGLKADGDPCSAQIHRNGKIVVYPHRVGWKEWLKAQLMSAGWSEDQAYLTIMNLRVHPVRVEVPVPKVGRMIKPLREIDSGIGVKITRDETPAKETLEVIIDIRDMQKHLRVPEIRKELGTISKELKHQRLETPLLYKRLGRDVAIQVGREMAANIAAEIGKALSSELRKMFTLPKADDKVNRYRS